MTNDHASELIRSSLLLALQLAGPLLLVCLLVGLSISLFQAATQLADQSLGFVPKLVVLAISSVALLPWMLQRLSEFSSALIESIPAMI
ncbi:MAG: flagellar biosynthetic protein FliQ [Planctomycetia bacterium]|nr:flagellar biosynthetic protein FliQ [Planctomycetia bacterium]